MKTIIFAVAGHNLTETGRHIEIGRACRDHSYILFLSYDGKLKKIKLKLKMRFSKYLKF